LVSSYDPSRKALANPWGSFQKLVGTKGDRYSNPLASFEVGAPFPSDSTD